jgi:hypothetical protein
MKCFGSGKIPNEITVQPDIHPHWLPGNPPHGKTGKGRCSMCNREIGLTNDGALMPHKTKIKLKGE